MKTTIPAVLLLTLLAFQAGAGDDISILTPGEPAYFSISPESADGTGDLVKYRLDVPEDAASVTVNLTLQNEDNILVLHTNAGHSLFAVLTPNVKGGSFTIYRSAQEADAAPEFPGHRRGPPLRSGPLDIHIYGGVSNRGSLLVTLEITKPPYPMIYHKGPGNEGAIALATGFTIQPVAPNALISVFGENFVPHGGGASGPALNDTGKIAVNLASTCLEITGLARLPLFFVSPDQINAQITHKMMEWFVPGMEKGLATMYVIRGCDTEDERRSPAKSFRFQTVSPAFFGFPLTPDGHNPVIATVERDGVSTMVGPPEASEWIQGVTFTPAEPGEIVTMYGTGFGQTAPKLEAGQIAGAAVPLTGEVSFAFRGVSGEVLYAGAAPCCAGLYQFAVRLPSVAPGNVPVLAEVEGVQTPAGPFLTIGR